MLQNIVEKRRNCSSGAISPLFHNIFNISLTSRVQLYIYLLNVVNQISFSSVLQIWYVEVRISRSISESPLEFEITRVSCSYAVCQKSACQWRTSVYVGVPINIILFSAISSPVFYFWTTHIRAMVHCGSTMDSLPRPNLTVCCPER